MNTRGSKAERLTGLQLTGEHVDSRWWYWVAAVPPVFAFWLVTVGWVAIAVALEPSMFGGDTRLASLTGAVVQSMSISLVAMGVPFVILTLLFPVAVYRDASDIAASAADWNPPAALYGVVGALGAVPLFLLALATLASGDVVTTGLGLSLGPTAALVGGFVLNVPFSLYYLRARHEHVRVP